MDLARQILLSVEQDALIKPTDLQLQKEVSYHVRLLEDAGLITWVTWGAARHGFPIVHQVGRLTWAGHEFLDATRNESIWNSAKERLLRPGVSWTFPLLLAYVSEQAALRLNDKESAQR